MVDSRISLGAAIATAIGTAAMPVATVLDIPVGVLLAALAGALFGLAHTPPERWNGLFKVPAPGGWRRTLSLSWRVAGLLFVTCANAFAVSWFVVVLPHLPGFGWAGKAPLAAGAGLLAFGSQYVILPLMKAAQRWAEAPSLPGGKNR